MHRLGNVALVAGSVFAGEDVFQLREIEFGGRADLVDDAIEDIRIQQVLVNLAEVFNFLAPIHRIRCQIGAGLFAEEFLDLIHARCYGHGERKNRFYEFRFREVAQQFRQRRTSKQEIPPQTLA